MVGEKSCETCQFHREEVVRLDNQKERLKALEECTASLKSDLATIKTSQAVMGNDLKYIKWPLSVIAGAVILYVIGNLLKLMPYVANAGALIK